MKKVMLVLISTLLIVITACSQQAEEVVEVATDPSHEIEIEAPPSPTARLELPVDPNYVEIEWVIRRIMPQDSLAIEHFIEDLDYMIYVLQNNFALLPVAHWAHGVDYRELEARARAAILAMDEPCEDMFMAILQANFFPLRITGHFDIFTPSRYNSMHQGIYGRYHLVSEKAMMNYQLLRTDLPQRFYEPRSEDASAFWNALYDVVQASEAPIYHRIWGYMGTDVDWEYLPVGMEILEEDNIALISPLFSMDRIWNARWQIFNFYRNIQGFDHLIIDMRNNGGGNVDRFLEVLLKPHLAEEIEVPPLYYFFLDGSYVRRFGEHLFTPTVGSAFMTITEPYRPAHEILALHDLPEFNLEDLERLHYGAPASTIGGVITPNTGPFGGQPAFDGTIWMLTDHRMGSAAQMAAWYAKETGVMTLVGDVTGGNMGGPRTMVLMPNTGIIFYFDIFYITDSRGRPLEAGTIPHYFNRPGMDALETVLALIAEGY